MPSLHALVYLAWRAVLVEPVKRIFQRGSGLDRFRAAFAEDRLAPTSVADREMAQLAARCVGCGLCEPCGRMSVMSPELRAIGLPAVFRLAGRANGDLATARELLAACRGCAGCEPRCPTGVPIGPVIAHLSARLAAR